MTRPAMGGDSHRLGHENDGPLLLPYPAGEFLGPGPSDGVRRRRGPAWDPAGDAPKPSAARGRGRPGRAGETARSVVVACAALPLLPFFFAAYVMGLGLIKRANDLCE